MIKQQKKKQKQKKKTRGEAIVLSPRVLEYLLISLWKNTNLHFCSF